MKKGIDISKWQGAVDFEKVKADWIEFVIPRCSYRQTVDPKFFEYVKGATDAGIPIFGVYHFIYALNEAQALEEAKFCIEQVKKAGLGTDIYIFADFEYDSVKKAASSGVTLGKPECNKFTRIFCEYVVSQGYKAGIYTNVDYYKNWFEQSLLKEFPIWLADYNGGPDFDCLLQQITSTGQVSGISTGVDIDYLYEEEVNEMPCYASTVIDIALGEVGYLEKKSNKNLDSKTANAGSANYTKYGRDMHNLYPAVMDFPAAWCDAFVDWCFQKAYGVSNAKGLLGGNFNDYTPSSAQLYKNKNAWGTEPKLGAQIFFKNSTRINHTGIVYAFDTKYVYTVEGNTSGASGVIANGGGVCKKKYLRTNSKIAGYGYPKYDEAPTVAPEPSTPTTTQKAEDVKMKTIKKNSTGKSVRVWQAILGYTGNDLDGKFGKGTEADTIALQKKTWPNDPTQWDGVVGDMTWKAGLESVK